MIGNFHEASYYEKKTHIRIIPPGAAGRIADMSLIRFRITPSSRTQYITSGICRTDDAIPQQSTSAAELLPHRKSVCS